jgi:hypothetical protein
MRLCKLHALLRWQCLGSTPQLEHWQWDTNGSTATGGRFTPLKTQLSPAPALIMQCPDNCLDCNDGDGACNICDFGYFWNGLLCEPEVSSY